MNRNCKILFLLKIISVFKFNNEKKEYYTHLNLDIRLVALGVISHLTDFPNVSTICIIAPEPVQGGTKNHIFPN